MVVPLGGGGGVKARMTCLDTKVEGKIWPDKNPQMSIFEFGVKSRGGGNVVGLGFAKAQSTPKFRFSATNQT